MYHWTILPSEFWTWYNNNPVTSVVVTWNHLRCPLKQRTYSLSPTFNMQALVNLFFFHLVLFMRHLRSKVITFLPIKVILCDIMINGFRFLTNWSNKWASFCDAKSNDVDDTSGLLTIGSLQSNLEYLADKF